MNEAVEHSKTILVAEDEPDLREALSAVLTIEGYGVIPAEDGAEALELALQEKPDLILLDILMPKMSGIEVLKALQEDEWGKKANVIVLTANSDLNQISDAVDVAGSELKYLIKTDWRLEDVVRKIKEEIGE